MAIRTYKVPLDTKNAIAPEPVFLRQGDKTGAVVIDATLMDNGAPISLDGLTPMFKANTADGQAVIADSTGFNIVNASGGEFTYQVPNALSSVPGKIMTAYFSFSDTSGSESTFDVAFVIKKAVDITQPQADNYITIVDGTIQSLQQKIDAMNTDVQTILNAFNQGNFYNKTQTDSKDAATLASAKSYADTQDTSTLASAKAYADTQDAATVDISIWHNETMRNGFTGNVHWRTLKFASSNVMLVEVIGTVSNLKDNSGKLICDFPSSLVPAREIPFTWAQPRNNDFEKVGISIGGNITSIRLNFTAGGPSNLPVDIHQVYWTDIA